MYSKGYLYINKYFAFAFMVFAVLSGVSDNYSNANAIKIKDSNLAYFLNINNLFVRSSSNAITQAFAYKYNAFREYIQGIMTKSGAAHIYMGVISCSLFIVIFHLNNQITRNNIWRKAVF